MVYKGKISWFGGPGDTGVSLSENLALYGEEADVTGNDLFLPYQPENTTGLARRLNPSISYCAMRWNYEITPKNLLRFSFVKITNPIGRNFINARIVDWGPNADTGRLIDASPMVLRALNLKTDDLVEAMLFTM